MGDNTKKNQLSALYIQSPALLPSRTKRVQMVQFCYLSTAKFERLASTLHAICLQSTLSNCAFLYWAYAPLSAGSTSDIRFCVGLWSFYTGVSPHLGRSLELAVSVAVPLGRQRPFYTLLAFTLLPSARGGWRNRLYNKESREMAGSCGILSATGCNRPSGSMERWYVFSDCAR